MKCRGLLYKFPCLFFCKIPSKSVDFIPFLTEYPADCQSDSGTGTGYNRCLTHDICSPCPFSVLIP